MIRSIEAIATDWVSAELERKMRKREARIACLLAFQAGVTLEDVDDREGSRRELVAETDEQRTAMCIATAARARYIKAAAHAGSLRSGLTLSLRKRGLLTEPFPDHAIMKAYDALCAKTYDRNCNPEE